MVHRLREETMAALQMGAGARPHSSKFFLL